MAWGKVINHIPGFIVDDKNYYGVDDKQPLKQYLKQQLSMIVRMRMTKTVNSFKEN